MLAGTAGCVLHCTTVCVLCTTGGAAVSAAFAKTCRLAVRHILPALLSVGYALLLSSAGDFV